MKEYHTSFGDFSHMSMQSPPNRIQIQFLGNVFKSQWRSNIKLRSLVEVFQATYYAKQTIRK